MPKVASLTVTVPLAGGQIIGASQGRLGLIFPVPVTNRYTISPQSAAALDQGQNLVPGANPLEISGPSMRGAAQAAWFGVSAIADQVISIIEVFE